MATVVSSSSEGPALSSGSAEVEGLETPHSSRGERATGVVTAETSDPVCCGRRGRRGRVSAKSESLTADNERPQRARRAPRAFGAEPLAEDKLLKLVLGKSLLVRVVTPLVKGGSPLLRALSLALFSKRGYVSLHHSRVVARPPLTLSEVIALRFPFALGNSSRRNGLRFFAFGPRSVLSLNGGLQRESDRLL